MTENEIKTETAEIIGFPNPDEVEGEDVSEQDVYEAEFHKGASFQRELEERYLNERKVEPKRLEALVNLHLSTDGDVTFNTPEAMEHFILVQSEQIEALNKMLLAEKTKYNLLLAQLKHFDILKKEQ